MKSAYVKRYIRQSFIPKFLPVTLMFIDFLPTLFARTISIDSFKCNLSAIDKCMGILFENVNEKFEQKLEATGSRNIDYYIHVFKHFFSKFLTFAFVITSLMFSLILQGDNLSKIANELGQPIAKYRKTQRGIFLKGALISNLRFLSEAQFTSVTTLLIARDRKVLMLFQISGSYD